MSLYYYCVLDLVSVLHHKGRDEVGMAEYLPSRARVSDAFSSTNIMQCFLMSSYLKEDKSG